MRSYLCQIPGQTRPFSTRSKPQRISGTVKQFVCVVAALLTLDVSFVKAGGSFSILDRPGARVTNASGLNTQGQIVGTFSDQAQRVHGFIYTGGSFSTLDGPWPGYTFLTDINAHEQIVGYFRDHITGNNRVFSTITWKSNMLLVRKGRKV
ncbi:MAG: hypothetical protein HOP18_05980 [Deltaproteobacteria bacterium]|nr:hypothetical protein [Deltaproteobacteria bacterium]